MAGRILAYVASVATLMSFGMQVWPIGAEQLTGKWQVEFHSSTTGNSKGIFYVTSPGGGHVCFEGRLVYSDRLGPMVHGHGELRGRLIKFVFETEAEPTVRWRGTGELRVVNRDFLAGQYKDASGRQDDLDVKRVR